MPSDMPKMNPLLSIPIEFGVYAFAILIGIHVWRKEGKRWFATLLWGVIFGTITEWLITHGAHDPNSVYYQYNPGFIIPFGTGDKLVPLWVGVGWGCILFAATWTAQRLELPWWLRPFAAAILAINIDLSLDPVANLAGFWKWINVDPVKSYYGVPFDNYHGWFWIVASYAYFVRAGFHLYDKLTGRTVEKKTDRFQPTPFGEFFVPFVAALAASAVLFVLRRYATDAYRAIGESNLFMLTFLPGAYLFWRFALKAHRDNPPNKVVLAIPIAFHSFAVLALFIVYPSSFPTLLIAIPSQMLFGFLGYGWSSLEIMFPTPQRLKRSKYAKPLLPLPTLDPEPVPPPAPVGAT
jgi:uncharacterized membrane protein